MTDKIGKKLRRIVRNLLAKPENNSPATEEITSIENFLLSLGFARLYGLISPVKKRRTERDDHLNQVKNYIPDNIKTDFPFPDGLCVNDSAFKTLLEIIDHAGIDFPALVHDFFLDNSETDSIFQPARKGRGVYYTPHPVAKYIVDNTLKKKTDSTLREMRSSVNRCDIDSFISSWKEINSIRVVDPSCGWGIFLLYSFRKLSEFHRSAGNLARLMIEKEACNPFDVFDMLSNEYVDFIGKIEKLKEISITGNNPGAMIIERNIFGFDIDLQAIKIARHILLKEAGISPDEHPKTGSNVLKADFIRNFADIRERIGGFDYILGNPPYFTIGGGGKGKSKTDYHTILREDPFFRDFFRSQSDIFYYFITGGVGLLKPGGQLSFITPSYWLENEYADMLREVMVKHCKVEEIVNFTPIKVFQTLQGKPVNVDTTVFRIRKKESLSEKKGESLFNAYIPVEKRAAADCISYREFLDNLNQTEENRKDDSIIQRISVNQQDLSGGKWIISPHSEILSLMRKDFEKILPLGDISKSMPEKFPGEFRNFPRKGSAGVCSIGQGQETGLSEVFLLKDDIAVQLGLEREILKPVVKNSHVLRYGLSESGLVMIMLPDDKDLSLYPQTMGYLEKHRQALENRQRVKIGVRKWFAISIPQNYRIFDEPVKILVPYRATKNRFAIDTGRHFNDGGDVRGIVINEEMKDRFSYEYLIALLNSRLLTFWFHHCGKRKGNVYEYFTNPMSRIPIRIPDQSVRESLELLVLQIQDLYGEMRRTCNINRGKTVDDKISLKISEVEEEIDRIVYQLYGISNLYINIIKDSFLSG